MIQYNDMESLIQKFWSIASGKSEKSQANYAKAIKCFETFVGTYTYSSEFPSEQTLADWFLNMRVRGFSEKTAIHYLDIIAALYNEAEFGKNSESLKIFGQFKARAKQFLALGKKCPIDNRAFNRVLSITKSISSQPKVQPCAADILLFSLLNRAMPLAEVAKVKVSEIDSENDAISVIVRRNSDTNRKYLFALDQSKRTPKQLAENVEHKVKGLFIANNIPIVESVDNTIRIIWACAALICGIPASEIIALIGNTVDGIPEMALCMKADVLPERGKSLTETVNTLFSNNPLRWYAMKLRSRVDFEEVEERVMTLEDNILRPEFFYPLDEICKRIGKKLIKEKQPVIRDIVFFKLRVTDIFPLFSRIGDLAWCYTTTGKPGGDYAPIPVSSFNRFQETIGHFTPEYEIAPIGGFEPKEGETVVIVNGPLSSYGFEVGKAKEDNDNIIFQLNMIGDNGFQWRTTAKKRQLKPTAAK